MAACNSVQPAVQKERHEESLLQSIIESIWGEKKYRRKFVVLQKKNTFY